ncbi:PAS domain S-box protein [Dongia rigui]|uniref:histidine kinase n=1 Tax=Dongia rigui TaxID=940149 RepID=A0ABU5DU45_9PROT|nr:PAS domain S-box protein [Dongia rigui]MDY0870839.1 PAS domain S-box protein [Dongia rigui]
MTPAPTAATQRDTVAPITAAFLAELARLPAVQEGDLEAVAALACKRALDLVDARYLSVWMLDADRAQIRSIVRYDAETGQRSQDLALPIGSVAAELAALQQTTQIVSDDALADPRFIGVHDSYLRETGVISLLEHVIRVGGTDVGLLSFERTAQTTPWQPTDLALARGICSYLALAAANRQRIELEKQSAGNAALQAAILENAAYAVIASDINGTITFFNRAAEQMLGYRSEEVVNKTTPILFHDPVEVEQRAAQLSSDPAMRIQPGFSVFTAKTLAGERNEEEWTYVRRDGSRFTALLSMTAIRGPDGAINGFLGMASDITERKLVSSRLQQSEEMLSRVLLQSPDSILITALADGRILDVNPGFEQITGYSRQEAIGRTTVDLNIWVDLDERDDMLGQVRTQGEVRSMPIRISRRGQEVRYCVLWGRTFEYNGVAALLTSVHDVTSIKEAEQRARTAQNMLQAVLDTVPAHVFWKDRNSVYLGCNRQFAVDNGFASAAEVIGTTDYSQLRRSSPAALAEIGKVIEADRQIIAGKQATTPRTVPFVMPDDSLRWMSVVKRPLLDDNGDVIGILGVQHDITEMIENERVAKNAQHMLQQVLDTIPSYVFWKDRQSRYLGSNRLFAQDAGFADPSGIVGKSDSELPWSDHADLFVEEDREVLAGTPLLERVKKFPDPQGNQRWIRTEKLPLLDAGGDLIGVLGVQHDITEQLRSEEQLRASEEKLRSLFALSPLGINLQDMNGRYIDANDAFLQIVGYSHAELLGMTCYDLMPPAFLEDEPERLRRLHETGLIPAYEKSYYRKDGSEVSVSTATVLVAGPEGQDFKWTIVEDITIRLEAREAQRKLNDELERLVAERTAELQAAIEGLMRAEKLASLGSLVAGVAHEISTPVGNASLATSTLVGAISDFEAELAGKLSRNSLDGFVRQVKLGVDIANRNIERVAGLIQSFKQVAVDQTSSQRRHFQMTEIVDEILTTMHPSLKRAGVATEVSVEPALMLDSYPGPLGQVLTNLINNAILHGFPKGDPNALPAGARRIGIKAQAVDAQMIRLEVRDNGVGIPAAALGRIFDPFYTSKLGQGGSGLGLHIVHNIVTDVLAGSVSVESDVGTGTAFVITLPQTTPQATAATDQEDKA